MARKTRIKLETDAFYHVVSRIAHKAYLMDDAVKRRMLDILYASADFSGVVVGTYMLMDNHFHLLVQVPAATGEPVPESVVLQRVETLYGGGFAKRVAKRLGELREQGREAAAEAMLDRYRRRMRDISEFVKTFKQRVTQWYNSERGHEGTLWSGRFKGVLVEEGVHLATCMRYIHNNPVSAGMSAKTADYAWGAPGAALRGDRRAREGLRFIAATLTGCAGGGGFSWKMVDVPVGRDLRFSNGLVMGSARFVEKHVSRWLPPGSKRRWRPVRVMGTIYASHGQRSSPERAQGKAPANMAG